MEHLKLISQLTKGSRAWIFLRKCFNKEIMTRNTNRSSLGNMSDSDFPISLQSDRQHSLINGRHLSST